MRRVVITGLGIISGSGVGVARTWENMCANVSGRTLLAPPVYFNPLECARACTSGENGLITSVSGVPHTDTELVALASAGPAGIDPKDARRCDRHQLFAYIAAHEAMADALPLWSHWQETRFGVYGGTGTGGIGQVYRAVKDAYAGKRLGPFTNIAQLPNLFVGLIASRYGIKGTSHTHTTACAAASHALEDAVHSIIRGVHDAALVVGAEAAITEFGIASFCAQRALANDSKPYQKSRSGFLMGEGAAALRLEALATAHARGARIYAEVVGLGSTTDGVVGGLITDPSPTGGERSARQALAMAGIQPAHVAYINAHGTGTPTGDAAELKGIHLWAGEHAPRIPISSTKSFMGHLLGAAGAAEALLCAKMLDENVMLPTHGLTEENYDDSLSPLRHVMHAPQPLAGEYILSNSFGFGGTNASLILKRWEGFR